MPDILHEILTKFFRDHLPFCPTPRQVADFQQDLCLISPSLMEASLKEVRAGTKGYLLVYRPNEWRPAIFEVYNRKVAEHALLFPIFHSFETAFRSTVAVALERHYNHGRWWRGIYEELRRAGNPKNITQVAGVPMSRHAAFRIGKIIESIDGESFARNIVGTLTSGYDFLEHCDLAHICQLIEEHWAVFGPVFKPLVLAEFSAKFERVRLARNEVYHHKSLAGMSAVISTAEELLDRLNFSLRFVHRKTAMSKPTSLAFSCPIEPRHRTW